MKKKVKSPRSVLFVQENGSFFLFLPAFHVKSNRLKATASMLALTLSSIGFFYFFFGNNVLYYIYIVIIIQYYIIFNIGQYLIFLLFTATSLSYRLVFDFVDSLSHFLDVV